MPDKGEGGNNGEKGDKSDSQTDVLESPEVKAALEAARKEGNSEGYRKGQSDGDTARQAALDSAKTSEEALTLLEKQRFDAMSSEDQNKEMVRKLYEGRNPPKAKEPEQQKASDSKPDADKKPDGDNAALIEAAKEAGLDPEKLDMDHGMTKFLASVAKAQKEGSEKGSKGSDSEEDKDKTKSKSGGPVDGSGGSVIGTDITKVNPEDIFRNVHSKKHGGS